MTLVSIHLLMIFLVLFVLAVPALAERQLSKLEVFPSDVTLRHARDRQSLVVQATYSGGERFMAGDEEYNAIIRWLDAGVPNDLPDVIKPVSMEILPRRAVLEGTGAAQRLTVRATYSDGSKRDVTRLCLFLSNNDATAKIDPSGVVTAGQRGEAFVMARFATFTVGSQVIVIPKDLKYEWPGVPENNSIDTLVFNKHKKLRLIPSGLCSDEVFVRRAFLDIAGVLPTRAECDRFLANPNVKKRDQLIDELLGRKEFVEMWVMKFSELLDELARRFTEYHYDFKKLVADICRSRVTSFPPSPTNPTSSTPGTMPGPRSGASAPRCCSTSSRR